MPGACNRSTEAALVGSVPAIHSCQLFMPSPSVSSLSAEPSAGRPYCWSQPKEIRLDGDWYLYSPTSTVPPTMRGFPSRSVVTETKELAPALMQGESGCNRRLPLSSSMNRGALVKLPVPPAGSGVVQQLVLLC